MSKTESIHIGFVSEYKPDKAIIHVARKDYHVPLTKKEANFLDDTINNEKLNYIAFDIANEQIITYDAFQMADGEVGSKNLYLSFVNLFVGGVSSLKKKLNIYRENNLFIIEREDEAHHDVHKEYFSTEESLFEAIEYYRPFMKDYRLSVEEGIGILHRIHYILFA